MLKFNVTPIFLERALIVVVAGLVALAAYMLFALPTHAASLPAAPAADVKGEVTSFICMDEQVVAVIFKTNGPGTFGIRLADACKGAVEEKRNG